MNPVNLVVLCLALMLFSLITVSLINRLQSRNRLMRQRAQTLRRRITELEELCAAIEPLLESVLIPSLVNAEVIDLIHTVKRLDSSATHLDVHLEQAQMLARDLNNDRRTQPLYRLMPSDAAIAKNKYYLTEAARLVRKRHAQGQLQTAEFDAFLRELIWAHLMVDVISFIGHGHKAIARGEPLVAYSFYRKAQNVLVGASVDDDRRHRFIREIGEILASKRPALSLDLMPESDFNPAQMALQASAKAQAAASAAAALDRPA